MILGEDLSVLLARTEKTIVFVTHSLGEAVFPGRSRRGVLGAARHHQEDHRGRRAASAQARIRHVGEIHRAAQRALRAAARRDPQDRAAIGPRGRAGGIGAAVTRAAQKGRDGSASRLVQVGVSAGLLAAVVSRDHALGRQSAAAAATSRRLRSNLVDILRAANISTICASTLIELGGGLCASRWPAAPSSAISSAARAISIRVFEPLFAGIYSIPIILFLPLYVLVLRPRPRLQDRARRHHQLLSDRPQHHCRLRQRRPHAVSPRRAPWAPPTTSSSAYVLVPAALPVILDRTAHGLHGRAAGDHRQRNHRLARRPRPSHRAARGGHGDGAHVRLHRLRRRDRGDPQCRCVSRWKRAGDGIDEPRRRRSCGVSCAASRARAARRHRGAVRGVGDRRALVRRSAVPEPAVAGARLARRRVRAPPACRRRCGSPSSSSPSRSSSRSPSVS